MNLDFTALNNLAQRAEKVRTAPILQEGNNTAIQQEKPAGQQGDARSRAINLLDRERQDKERSREMYACYQQNIKRAGTLREEVIKGIKRGEDPLAILLKAVECISLMTGDTALYSQCKANVIEVYGHELKQPAAIKMELDEAKCRLAAMTGPDHGGNDTPPDEQKRTETAIQSTRELIDRLEKETA